MLNPLVMVNLDMNSYLPSNANDHQLLQMTLHDTNMLKDNDTCE
jgi:hypothetical protein